SRYHGHYINTGTVVAMITTITEQPSQTFQCGLMQILLAGYLVSMSCEPVSAINYYEDLEPPIEIRVIKKWVPYKKGKWIPPKKSTKLCYLFVDIHGDAIEAIAHIDSQSYFDSIITVQSCYIVNNYISQPQRRYMPAVPHKASIRFGR
ncbi:hypothetical protein M8C21_004496, partial [Ambrosia artemisiifolia]